MLVPDGRRKSDVVLIVSVVAVRLALRPGRVVRRDAPAAVCPGKLALSDTVGDAQPDYLVTSDRPGALVLLRGARDGQVGAQLGAEGLGLRVADQRLQQGQTAATAALEAAGTGAPSRRGA